MTDRTISEAARRARIDPEDANARETIKRSEMRQGAPHGVPPCPRCGSFANMEEPRLPPEPVPGERITSQNDMVRRVRTRHTYPSGTFELVAYRCRECGVVALGSKRVVSTPQEIYDDLRTRLEERFTGEPNDAVLQGQIQAFIQRFMAEHADELPPDFNPGVSVTINDSNNSAEDMAAGRINATVEFTTPVHGDITFPLHDPYDESDVRVPCPQCGGTGDSATIGGPVGGVMSAVCACDGTGLISDHRLPDYPRCTEEFHGAHGRVRCYLREGHPPWNDQFSTHRSISEGRPLIWVNESRDFIR